MSHPWYFDEREGHMLIAMNWLDSTNALLSDSTQWSEFQRLPLVSSSIPEVMREGQKIHLELNISEPAQYTFQLLNLSAEIVRKNEQVLGMGSHRIAIPTKGLAWGVYHLEIATRTVQFRQKIMIRG